MIALVRPLLILAFLLTGCATIEANRIELAKWQGMADQATKAMGVGEVTVRLKANTTTGVYLRLERALDLGTLSGPEGMTWLLAHELSHHILGHVNTALKEEMEANAMAVKVLQVWGRSEAEAVRLVESRLLLIRRTGSTLTGQRHDWCAEYHDIARRYPSYAQPEGAAVCAGATR